VHGTASIEWLEGHRFLILRSRNDHPDFPDAISIIGFTDVDRVDARGDGSSGDSKSRLRMHYFDSRGVFRVFEMNVDAKAWRLSRDAPGFSQRLQAASTMVRTPSSAPGSYARTTSTGTTTCKSSIGGDKHPNQR
jgi:hypothetical protein